MEKIQGGGTSIPVHYYLDHSPYFITAATYHHQRLLTDPIKPELHRTLHRVFAEYGWRIDHWVILDDHYHLLARSHTGRDRPRIINKVHNQTAQRINRSLPADRRAHQRVWYNYWDYCPRNERDYRVRLCYLLNNPYKHGYVEDLHDWPWSSFRSLFGERGDEETRRLFRDHPEYRSLRLPEDDL